MIRCDPRKAWGTADWILPLTEPLPSPASYKTEPQKPAADSGKITNE
jgi:hypothetical protein